MSDEMVELGEHLVIPMPEPDLRHAWNVGEHRMVQVFCGDEVEAKWQCFDHGPQCWMTFAARLAEPDHSVGETRVHTHCYQELEAERDRLRELVRWTAQTLHQAHHAEDVYYTETPSTFMTCKKNTCDAARQELERA